MFLFLYEGEARSHSTHMALILQNCFLRNHNLPSYPLQDANLIGAISYYTHISDASNLGLRFTLCLHIP